MTVSLEISLYPFAENYPDDVNLFLEKIYAHPDIKAETNSMSTLITGEYHAIMHLINEEIFRFFKQNKAVFIMKLSNGCVI